jgi:hypothetical protein
MKLENNRTALLDSKASTYSGLLGVAVTVLTALGGAITIRGLNLHEIKTQMQTTTPSLIVFFLFYIVSVVSFIVGAGYAFKAYNLGFTNETVKLKESKDSSEKFSGEKSKEQELLNKLIGLIRLIRESSHSSFQEEKVCYYTIDFDYIAKNCDQKLVHTKRAMIPYLRNIILNNSNTNNQKSKNINRAHTATLVGISFLILLIFVITINSIGIL